MLRVVPRIYNPGPRNVIARFAPPHTTEKVERDERHEDDKSCYGGLVRKLLDRVFDHALERRAETSPPSQPANECEMTLLISEHEANTNCDHIRRSGRRARPRLPTQWKLRLHHEARHSECASSMKRILLGREIPKHRQRSSTSQDDSPRSRHRDRR